SAMLATAIPPYVMAGPKHHRPSPAMTMGHQCRLIWRQWHRLPPDDIMARTALATAEIGYSVTRIPANTVGPGVWYPFTGSNFESKMFQAFTYRSIWGL